jgi:hypothetical protein
MVRTSARRRTGVLLAALLVLGLPAAASAAAPGTPDAGFAGDGVASLTFPGDLAVGAAVLPSGGNLAVIGNTATTTSTQGRTIVTGLDSAGGTIAGFGSLTPWPNAAPIAGTAVRTAAGRIVVATTGTPGNAYPYRVQLLGFTATGQLDPAFGTGGRRTLTVAGRAERLLRTASGTLLLAGETTAPTGSIGTGAFLTRLTADGTVLGTSTLPIPAGDGGTTVNGAVQTDDGGVIIAGTDPALYLARFTPAGLPDAA